MRTITTGRVLIGKIENAAPTSWAKCDREDPDVSLNAPFGVDVEFATADRAPAFILSSGIVDGWQFLAPSRFFPEELALSLH